MNMPRAVPATAPEIDVWRFQNQMTATVVAANLNGLTHEDSLVLPQPGGNRLNWVLGHLLSAYNGLLTILNHQPVMEDAVLKRYARGAPPLENPADAVDFQRLLAAWGQATERIDTALAGMDPETFDRPVPNSPSGNPDETVRSLVTTVMFHQAYHAGQTGVLRRIAGKQGAIR
jgi:uncharacterized damage-inducible protein DinB